MIRYDKTNFIDHEGHICAILLKGTQIYCKTIMRNKNRNIIYNDPYSKTSSNSTVSSI